MNQLLIAYLNKVCESAGFVFDYAKIQENLGLSLSELKNFRKFLNELFKKNSLIKGELEIGGRTVDLKKIDMPLINIYAEQDHLVPPSSSMPLGDLVSSRDVTTKSFPVGHIGMYVSSKAIKGLAPTISEWVIE